MCRITNPKHVETQLQAVLKVELEEPKDSTVVSSLVHEGGREQVLYLNEFEHILDGGRMNIATLEMYCAHIQVGHLVHVLCTCYVFDVAPLMNRHMLCV